VPHTNRPTSEPSSQRLPRPIVSVHGEDVDLEVPGLVSLRASYLSEGLFDELAGGDPAEEDLYEVEVTDLRYRLFEPFTFARLSPSSTGREWLEETESAPLPMESFLLALGWTLANADASTWREICDAYRVWDSWTIEDALQRLPEYWQPEPLLPDLD
jgi:hypothetical protein